MVDPAGPVTFVRRSSSTELSANKQLVQRLVDEAVNQRNLEVLDEVATGPIIEAARWWIGPFSVDTVSFPTGVMVNAYHPAVSTAE